MDNNENIQKLEDKLLSIRARLILLRNLDPILTSAGGSLDMQELAFGIIQSSEDSLNDLESLLDYFHELK